MSSIFGYIQKRDLMEGRCIDIQSMRLWNLAYGEDGEETISGKSYGFGSVLEKLSAEAVKSSPVIKIDKKYAVMDVVLYNREEMTDRCKMTETLSDEELLFQYIELFGIEGLKDVNGDFAGAIYDETDQSLVLFRDHMGIRPLFYYADDKLVVFSTDIRGVISVKEVDATISEEWIYKTIAGYMNDGVEATEFQHVFCVAPGSAIRLSFVNDKVESKKVQYWQVGAKKVRYSSEQQYIDKLRELITESIQRRLDAISGLVGAELSGGLDSGVIDILINRLGRDAVYFSWSANPKELPYAENDERLRIADICRQENIVCNYREIGAEFKENSIITKKTKQILPELDMGELATLRYVLPPYINTKSLCETSEYIYRRGARTVFTGHGGDEGVSHRCNPYELFYYHEYLHFFRQVWSFTAGQKRRLWKFAKRCGKILIRTRRKFREPFRSPFRAPELLRSDFAAGYVEKKMPVLTFAYDAKDYIRRGGSRNRLDNVALMGAYGGARYIIPFLDYRVVDFAVSIPRYMYLRGNKNRYIFREAFRDIMPESLYNIKLKESTSNRNIDFETDWKEEYLMLRKEIVSKLDREFWKKYLDFDFIDRWMENQEPVKEEQEGNRRMLWCLFYCAMAQNLVEKTRGKK